MKLSKPWAYSCLLVIGALWGIVFPLTKLIIGGIGTFALLCIRFAVGGALVCVVFRKQFASLDKRSVLVSVFLGLVLFAANILQLLGLTLVSATESAFIIGLCVVFVPFFSWLLIGKRADCFAYIGLVLYAAGLYFITFDRAGFGSLSVGHLISLAGSGLFGLYYVLIAKLIKPAQSVASSGIVLFVCAVSSGVCWFLFERDSVIVFSPVMLVSLLIISLFSTGVCYCGHIYLQRYTDPVPASLLISTEPVFACLFSAIIPDAGGAVDPITLRETVGILVISLGIVCAAAGAYLLQKIKSAGGESNG